MDLFGTVPEPLRQYLPSFRHALVDLAKVDDERLSEDLRLRGFLATLKYGRRADVNEHLGVILVRRDDDLGLKLTYLDKVAVLINSDAVNEALSWLPPQRKEKTVGYLTQSFYDKGKVEGRAEGETLGEAKMLIRFLENRFGGLPDFVRRRIFSGTASEIDSWGNRVCHATDLQSIFDSN